VVFGRERPWVILDQPVVVPDPLQRVANFLAIGRSGKVDGLGKDMGQVVGMGDADRRIDLLDL